MRGVPVEECLDFASRNGSAVIGDRVNPLEPMEVRRLEPLPEELADVSATVRSLPARGS
jgi:hypothetical protein